jgi:hypothetical protein
VAVSLRSQPHIFNPKESLPFTHYITFRSFRYTPLSSTTFIRSDKPSPDPAKETTLHAKNSASTPGAVIALISLTLHSVLSACRPRSTRNGFALHFGGRESTPLSLRRFPTASLLKAAFPALFSAVTAPTQSSAYKKWRLISSSFKNNLFYSTFDTSLTTILFTSMFL